MARSLPVVVALFLTFPALANADLAVTSEAPAWTHRNEPLTWTGTITNLGPDPALDVRVDMTLGYSTGCYEATVIGTLQVGETRNFTCTRNTPDIRQVYSFYASLGVFSSNDTRYENNTAATLVRIDTPPDLFIFTNNAPLVAPKLKYPIEITYGNRASNPATNGLITITAPSRILSSPNYCAIDGNTARCNTGTVDSGALSHLPIEVEAPDESALTFAVEMSITADEQEVEPFDNHFTRTGQTFRTFFVRNVDDAGADSLRAAVDAANAQCTDIYPCMIAFRIPSGATSTHTISLQSPLAKIAAQSLFIDGTTQNSYYAGTSIVLDGASMSEGNAIDIAQLCNGTVRALDIRHFSGIAISFAQLPGCATPFSILTIANNTLADNGRGIVAAAPASISDNTIERSTRSAIFLSIGKSFVSRNVLRDNGASGIFVAAAASGTDISDNAIRGNREFGIAVDPLAENVSAHRNNIGANGQHGIDWGLDGTASITPIPLPEITNVRVENGKTIIEATSTAFGSFSPAIEVFASDEPDPSGYGEGKIHLREASVIDGKYTLTVDGDLHGQWITATATRAIYNGWLRSPKIDTDGDTGWGYYTTTSEFSRAVQVP